jgi:hypothetical protein
MNRGRTNGAHLVQDDGDAASRQLPSRLAAGKTAADDMYGQDMNQLQFIHHFLWIGRSRTRR